MSGIAKGIGKIFQSVGNFVKKIALPALAVAAVVFTGGAALGLAPLAAGFGGAVTSALGAVGLPTTGVIGSALTGAVTQAGYGAALGGAVSAATGQPISQGMTAGALGGAVTGGLGGALGAAPAAGAVTKSSMGLAPASGGLAQSAAPMARPAGMGVVQQVAEGGASAGVANMGAASNGLAGVVRGIASSPVAGHTFAGLGQGLLTGLAEKDRIAAEEDALKDISKSYAGMPGEQRGVTSNFGPRRYKFNRNTGDIDYA